MGEAIVPERFEPGTFPRLGELGARLREMAGDAAYAAGRDYLRKGLVRHGTVAGTTAHATVSGSTEYRVSVAFATDLAEAKVSCTCPAHRRNKLCKHVVAVAVALLERPREFTPVAPVDVPAEAAKPRRASGTKGGTGRAGGTAKERAAAQRTEQQDAGLAVVDRLLAELAAGGLGALGTEGAALLAEAAETVRALKLRRLGNRLMALQRLSASAAGASTWAMAGNPAAALFPPFGPTFQPPAPRQPGTGEADGPDEAARFAAILCDVALVRQALGAQAEGRIALDPALAEDLLGKTWRETELERVAGLDLVPIAEERFDDGEFRVETSYLLDLRDGAIYAEKQISPLRRGGAPKTAHRHRLLVDEAGLYPGEPPRRVKLLRVRREPLDIEHVDALLRRADATVPALRARLGGRLRSPFAAPEAAVLFRPSALVQAAADGTRLGALDKEGRFLAIAWPERWGQDLPALLPAPGRFALFGLLRLGNGGPTLRCLSVAGELAWGEGPVYPVTAS